MKSVNSKDNACDENIFVRLEALKLACELAGDIIFDKDKASRCRPGEGFLNGSELKEFFEIAEYNYRFIVDEDLDIDSREQGDKASAYRSTRTGRPVVNIKGE
jgi:hypothetical protein